MSLHRCRDLLLSFRSLLPAFETAGLTLPHLVPAQLVWEAFDAASSTVISDLLGSL